MISESVVAIMMFVCSFIGFLVNWSIVTMMIKVTKLKKPFAILTVGLSTADGVFSTLYLFYATPMVLLQNQFLTNWSHICGYILMICYDASTCFHFLISLNRFLAVYKPVFYNKMFSISFTKCIVAGAYLSSFSVITLFFQILGCENYYNPELRAFRYSEEDICKFYGKFGDFYQVFTLTLTSTALDFLAISKVIKLRSGVERSSKELNFLKQSISQTLFVLTIVCCFTWGPRIFPDRDYAFIFSSILWSSVHCFDGIFTVIFNPELRKKIGGDNLSFVVVSNLKKGTM